MALIYEKWSAQPTATTIDVLDRLLLIQNSTGLSKQITWQTIAASLPATGVQDVTASSPLASSGGLTPNITLASPVPVSLGGSGQTALGTALQVLRTNAAATGTEWATLAGSGTVTSVSVTTANGVSGSVATATTTPAITLTLGAITPTSVNGNTISTGTGTLTLSTFTVTAAGNATISGTNTGDQLNIAGNSNTATNLQGGLAGQIAYQTGASTTTFLAVGTNGYVLTLSGGLPVWAPGGGGSVTSVTASSPLASSGGANPNITLSTSVPISLGGTGRTAVGTALQVLRTNAAATGTEWATIASGGTVTSVSVTTANGVSGSVATATTTPAITLTLGNITPTTVNGLTIVSGAYTLTMLNDATVYGINSGDQLNVLGSSGSSDTATILDDNATNSAMNVTWVTSNTGNLPIKVSTTGLRFNPNTKRLGVGVATPLGAVDIAYNYDLGVPSLFIGADATTDDLHTRTNATDKIGTIAFPHYTNAELPMAGIMGFTLTGSNLLYFGGGTSNLNACTQMRFYTGATTTTPGGTAAMAIVDNGDVGIGTLNMSARTHILGEDSTSGLFALKVDNSSDAPIIHARNDVTVGIGMTNAVAFLQIAAGTTTKAPFRLTSGTNKTTAAAGEMEYDGTNLFFTRTGTTRETIITASAVNVVSPTSPNRTLTINHGGTTYYVAAKTTND